MVWLGAVRDRAWQELGELRAQIVTLKMQVQQHIETEAKLKQRANDAEDRMAKVLDESAETRKSAETLTNSLVRLEEEREKWALQDNTQKSEALNLRNGLEKANAEVERLRHLVQVCLSPPRSPPRLKCFAACARAGR